MRCSFLVWVMAPVWPAGQAGFCVATRVSLLVSVDGVGRVQGDAVGVQVLVVVAHEP